MQFLHQNWFLGAVLGVAIGYYVSAAAAADDEDFPHLVMWKLSLVSLYVAVARFQYHIAILAIVYGFENCFVPFVDPILSHGLDSAPRRKEVRSCLISPFYYRYLFSGLYRIH